MVFHLLKQGLHAVLPARIWSWLRSLTVLIAPRLVSQTSALRFDEGAKKIRIRTEEELQLQARGLQEVKNVFDTLKIRYFISGGTLLGIIREGDFIPWDWDVGIDLKIEDVYPRQEELLEALTKAGFEIVTHYPVKTNFKINAVKYGTRYEIAGLLKSGDRRYRKAYNYPTSLVNGVSTVVLRGQTYTTFTDPERYLEWLYGDWRIPIRTVDKSAYVTTQSRTKWLSRLYIALISKHKQ